MVTVPAGIATLGATAADRFRKPDELPIRTFNIREPFAMDTSGYKVFDPLNCTDGWLNTAPVGSLKPNAFGVHDMIGNVSEWIEDCHAPSHDAVSAAGAPPEVAGACANRIAKGGSWGTKWR